MKHCPRCNLRKPEACFTKKVHKKDYCDNCSNFTQFGGDGKIKTGPRQGEPGPLILTSQADPIYPSPSDQALIELARKEREAFKLRYFGEPLKNLQGARRPPVSDANFKES